ncbi:protein ROOT HAIR DEFECTIVE 3-like [Coffea arabica]|uniref:Protein ROOT HAIR DEFECTIVE 3-like n=1 Tax=Coffea arabica TaxID=13443 RepID=A0A6P6WT78_COFAR|nr:protein ROOT HAIR DEFECTIVE 3-like [Coffea arabica]XP_027116720.1 protein ROOT HAIR DEFECTIVE 3-like [Coffea arabica]XP_027116730.1 protein ROOT HAIR DEFECTIVE 3-like [Coffea arabica]XP_027116732.1 protein ROOT HAIR DEFECTIVE 3-like [Coffea arabica]
MAQQVEGNHPTLLIDGDGNFNSKFVDDLKLAAVSRPVAVVSVFGVQSTGKSTLMNSLHSTKFKVMDASQGMHQTTKGIWVAKCPLPNPNGGPEILAVDTEGSDGSEREDDTKFEKQTALFCLAVANTVIVNMKCYTVNLNNGGNRPLLRTIFEVMIRKFCTRRKVNLVFVLRDKNKCPLDKLEEQLKVGMYKIWEGMKKPEAQLNASLEDFFNIKVVALSNFEDKPEQFENEVSGLRERIISISTSGEGAAGSTPASGFADYAKKIWDKIKEDKDLDLPHYRIMVAEIRCNKIAEEKYQSFYDDRSWLQIEKDAISGAVQGFGAKVSPIIDIYLSQYDEETQHYDETKRDTSRKQLIENIMKVVKPTYLSVVEHMRHAILAKFEEAAMDELKKNGVLVAMKTHKYIIEFKNQLKDAAVKQANWNQDTEQLAQLESEIARTVEGIRATNELLEQQKKDKREFWFEVASIGANVVKSAPSVASVIMVAGHT